jgi:hypothetical protein
VRAPRFSLVISPHDPYLGPECRARAGKPAGFRSPHASDDDFEPAITFFDKFKCFLEDLKDFSRRVARAYYTCELNEHAIDSLHADIDVLSYLHRLSRNCFTDPEAPHEPRGLIQLHKRLVLEFGLPEGTQLDSEVTQNSLTGEQRELARNLTAWDDALPPGLFRPAELDALRVLTAQQDAGHNMLQDMFGGSAREREVDDENDLRLIARAADVTGVAWEASRAADGTGDQRMLGRIQRMHAASCAPWTLRSPPGM